MELKSNDKNHKNIFDINNILNKGNYNVNVSRAIIDENNFKYIMSVSTKGDEINKSILIMKFEYVIIGTYHENVWIWSTESSTLNKNMLKQCSQIKTILNKSLHDFVNTPCTILTSDEFKNTITNIGNTLYNHNNSLIYCKGNVYVDVIIITKILLNRIGI